MPIATSGNDSLTGTAWADTISGLAGNDTIYGNDGNDEVYGGAGADSLYGGNGNDAVSGGIGNDLVDGGAGGDNLVGGQGVDALYGGVGNDILLGDGQWLNQASYASGILGLGTTLTVTNSADGPIYLDWIDTLGNAHPVATIAAGQTYAFSTLSSNNYILKDEHGYFLEPITGALNQTVTYGPNLGDVLYGGANDDSMLGQYGDDTLYGDDGNDSVEGGTGNDSIFGGAGNDSLKAGTGNDAVYGGSGNDIVYGGDGDDYLGGATGNDTIYAGSGNDTLGGGAGDDTLTGGAGNDYFAFGDSDGHDLVGDFDMSLASGCTADQLDVSDLHNADGSPVRPWDITVSDNGQGQALLTFPGGESVVLGGVSPAQVAQHGMLHSMGVPCFAAGTRIMTPQGERRVEDISAGDLVTTASGDALAVLWHGQRLVEDLPAHPQNQPIRLAAGGFGNCRDLVLSPQHGVYLPQAGGLIRARHLVGISPRARLAKGIQSVSYHHLLLPQHALLMAEGALVESFYPGAMALAALSEADRALVRTAILARRTAVEAATSFAAHLADIYGPRCLPLLSGTVAARRLARPKPAPLRVRLCPQAMGGNQLAPALAAKIPP